MSVLRVVPWRLRVVSPPVPTAPSPRGAAASDAQGFACLSLHSGDVPAPQGLSPESLVTLCPLVGRGQTCESGPFPEPVGVQSRGLSWGWGLPA